MNNLTKTYIGVDVSKAFLDVYLYPEQKTMKFENSDKGIEKLLKECSAYKIEQLVCESSGGYENKLIQNFLKAGYKTWQADPRIIKAFIASEGVKFKTDTSDAKQIALFAAQKCCKYEKEQLTEEEKTLKELIRRKIDLTKMIVMEKQRLDHPQQTCCSKTIKAHIRFMEKQITSLEIEINSLINNNDQLNQKAEIMESIPGIGKTTSSILISTLPELGKIGNKQAAALVGVAPYTKESGTYKGVAKIKDGRREPRHAIYMAALTASRHNPTMKVFYERLIKRGKKPKVALVAVMRKIIVVLNVMLEKKQKWNPQVG